MMTRRSIMAAAAAVAATAAAPAAASERRDPRAMANELGVRLLGDEQIAMLLYPVAGQALAAFLILPGRYTPMPLADLATVASISVTGMAGTMLMFAAYRAAPPVIVAPTQYSQIAWAALFGALFFAEPLPPSTAIGVAIIAAAGMLVISRQDRQKLPT